MSATQVPCDELPSRVMVLQFQPELTHSVWVDYYHRCRSRKTLLKRLKREMTDKSETRRIVGFRFITINEESIGLNAEQLRKAGEGK